MPLVRSISGLRATVEDSMPMQLIKEYARAFASYLPEGKIIVGRDGRPSGEIINEILCNELVDCGRVVDNLGIVPTPTVQLYTEKSDAAGAIIITASHNPSEWNGLKFLNSSGVFLDEIENRDFWYILDNKLWKSNIIKGDLNNIEDAIDFHINSILKLDYLSPDIIDIIKSSKLKFVVDAVNASGSIIVPKFLKLFGIEVIELFCDNSGIFPHIPEPLPQNLTQLADAVKFHKADAGISVDPDADRLVLIDENGNPIGEELTISIAIDSVFSRKNAENKAVVNLSTTRICEDIAAAHNCSIERAAVGEINVVKKMKQVGAIIGGEGSGGVILAECHYGRDSLVGIALLLHLLAIKKSSLSKIADSYPKYAMLKHKQGFSGDLSTTIDKIKVKFTNASINLDDGVRVDFKDSWVQIRKSNTEPIIRIISEAPDKDQAQELIDSIGQLVD